MMKQASVVILLAVLALVAVPTLARAQAVTAYTATLSTGQTASIPVAAGGFVCGVTPKTVVTGAVVNPTKIIIDDPASPTTADCVYTDPGTGILRSLPFGPTSYTLTASATNAAGTSPIATALFPFTRPGQAPSAPAGLRLAQSSWDRLLGRKHYRVG